MLTQLNTNSDDASDLGASCGGSWRRFAARSAAAAAAAAAGIKMLVTSACNVLARLNYPIQGGAQGCRGSSAKRTVSEEGLPALAAQSKSCQSKRRCWPGAQGVLGLSSDEPAAELADPRLPFYPVACIN